MNLFSNYSTRHRSKDPIATLTLSFAQRKAHAASRFKE
jgi:hypothetical protein